MAWDFSTEPEFQEKLDWVEKFCKEEIEPLDLVFPGAVRSRHPKVKAIVVPAGIVRSIPRSTSRPPA